MRRAHDTLDFARTVLETEASAISSLLPRLSSSFVQAVDWLLACRGRVVTTGIGKPGFIAQKLSATLSSTGVPSLYLHPSEAAHGDMGRVTHGDVVIALSNSGATEELLLLFTAFKRLKVKTIVITGDTHSPMAEQADCTIDIGTLDEACPMGLVPTASSAALHAMADALAMCCARRREFTPQQYALLHPGGKLGRSVLRVREVMRAGEKNPLVPHNAPISKAILVMTNTPGRPGATHVVDGAGHLVGIFTDGDLRRLLERKRFSLRTPVSKVMGRRPRCVGPEDLVMAAASLMREAKVDQLPVVDSNGCPVGLLDVQDLLAARLF